MDGWTDEFVWVGQGMGVGERVDRWITVFRVVFGGWIGMWVEQSDLVDGLMDGWMDCILSFIHLSIILL